MWGCAIFDPLNGRVLLFGGEDWAPSISTKTNDTWAYDPETNSWEELRPAGKLPSARADHAMAYDVANDRIILFGGYDGSSCLDDTWAYDPSTNAWTELEPAGDRPRAREGHSLVYDPTSGDLILFGGRSWDWGELNDTWVYDSATNSWSEVLPHKPNRQ
jgi:N-acetylneuraminic acid mutarotase